MEAGQAEPSHSLPPFDMTWAMFLDVDGTRLDFAERPEKVVPRPGLIQILEAVHRAVPLVLVSGRRISDLDRLFAPLRLPIAGQHGVERRSADGRMHGARVAENALEPARAYLLAWLRDRRPIVLEDKGMSLALHYRGAPHLESEAARACRRALLRLGDGYMLAYGNKVFEIRLRGWDKGRAIGEFMLEAPFAGRMPVFAGDDMTDEDGFVAVNRAGGHSIKVGLGPTAAHWRLADTMQVMIWLDSYVKWFASQHGESRP